MANPSTTTGGPVGFWAAELTHPYRPFTEAGYDVTIASPDGGRVEPDGLSDPRDPSRWSAEDFVSRGFLETAELADLLRDTPALSELDLDAFDAIVVCGGRAPMFSFRSHPGLQRTLRAFFEAGRSSRAPCARGPGSAP